MEPFCVVKLKVLRQAQLQFRHVNVPFQIHVFVLDASPESFDKDVVQCPAAPIHADRNVVQLEYAGKRIASELTALVGIKYLRDAICL